MPPVVCEMEETVTATGQVVATEVGSALQKKRGFFLRVNFVIDILVLVSEEPTAGRDRVPALLKLKRAGDVARCRRTGLCSGCVCVRGSLDDLHFSLHSDIP